MRISDADVGRRVVVRHTIGGAGPTGGPAMTDVLGHVRSVAAHSVALERRDGSIAVVDLATVVSWKHVPEPPPRRRPQQPHR